jgi:hypothetical protein
MFFPVVKLVFDFDEFSEGVLHGHCCPNQIDRVDKRTAHVNPTAKKKKTRASLKK